jgi:hypothetical protein
LTARDKIKKGMSLSDDEVEDQMEALLNKCPPDFSMAEKHGVR